MDYTKNLGLRKLDINDFYGPLDQNYNMDVLDQAIQDIDGGIFAIPNAADVKQHNADPQAHPGITLDSGEF